MGGMVKGLEIQTRVIEIGRLARSNIPTRVAISICPGKGIKEIKIPMLTAVETL
jgi:hypothetical protein